MRKTVTVALAAVGMLIVGGHVAMAQLKVELSASDPKYNSPACVSMRNEAANYKDGITQQSPGTYIIAAVMPGGTVGFMILQQRKYEMFLHRIEMACMSNPPNRKYLDEGATNAK
jgi:hypothetical protein